MSRSRVIVDTGPIVAVLDRRDKYHLWAVEQFDACTEPFLVCEPVLTEAFFLLARTAMAQSKLFELLETGILHPGFRLADELSTIASLVRKYETVPMSLADACLVRMAELTPGARVLTLDSDFRIYRQNGRRQIPLTIPDCR